MKLNARNDSEAKTLNECANDDDDGGDEDEDGGG